MKKRSILDTVVLSAALVFIPLITRAALNEDSKVIQGIVKAVADNAVTVVVQSTDGKQISEVDIHANPETKYQDVTLKDLKEGDQLKVAYHDDEQVKIADMITKIPK